MRDRTLGPCPQSQTGGITIMVALMLLVLLTITALSMSRNSFRDVISSGFMRQASMSRAAAASGIEWSLYWLDLQNAPSATGSAQLMLTLKTNLLQNGELAGVTKNIIDGTNYPLTPPFPSVQPDMTLAANGSVTSGFSIGLTRMGKLPITDMSQGNGPGAFTPASGAILTQAPDLWSVRSDAHVQQGAVTFIHAQEAWISTPVQ